MSSNNRNISIKGQYHKLEGYYSLLASLLPDLEISFLKLCIINYLRTARTLVSR